MLFYPFLCFSTFIIASSATLTPGAVPLPPPAVTLAPRAGPSIATITLAPISEYEATATKTASPTGSDLTIVARSEPTDGVDVYLAPDLSKKVEDIIHDKCGAQKAPDCEKSVQDVMESQQMGLQARQAITLGLIGIWAAGMVAAAVIAMVSNNKPASHVHIPGGDIAQVSSASKASVNTIAVATTADDRSPITIVSSSDGSQPTGGVSVSTVSADSGGHKKGDVIISLPKELGDRVADYWEKTATCPKKRKRGTNLDCVVQDASSLMQQAGPNGPFRDLVITPNQHLPAIRPGDLLNALNQVIDAGRAIAFLALDNAGVQALAEICFWIAYEKGVEHIPSLVDFVMPEADITATADTPEETGNKDDCPEPEHEPVCSNCGGNDGKDHCKGIPEADNAWAGCPCVDGGYFPYRPYKDAQAFLDAQDALGKLPNGAGGGGDDSTPWCLHGGNPHDNGPAVIPEEYCQCGKDYAELYSTANGGGNGCPYKSAPGPTITLTPWTAQSYDGVTCSYPSTTSCATYNIPNNHPQRDLAVMTAAPDLDKRQGGNCIGSCPQHTDPPVAPVTCECQV